MKNKITYILIVLFTVLHFCACKNDVKFSEKEDTPVTQGVLSVSAYPELDSFRSAVPSDISENLVYFGKLSFSNSYVKNTGNSTNHVYVFDISEQDVENATLTVYACKSGTEELSSSNLNSACILKGTSSPVNIAAYQLTASFGSISLEINTSSTLKGSISLKIKTPENKDFSVVCKKGGTQVTLTKDTSDGYKIKNDSIDPGVYTVIFSLADNTQIKNPIHNINVFPSSCTNTWLDSDVNENGELELKPATLSDEILYVCGNDPVWYTSSGVSGFELPADFSTAGYTAKGTMNAPYKTLYEAVSKCTENKDYIIYVDGTTSETASSVFGTAAGDSKTSSLTIKALYGNATVKAGGQLSSSMLFIGKGRSAVIEGIVFDGDSVENGLWKNTVYTKGYLYGYREGLSNYPEYYGAGICSYGSLTMNNCTVENCYIYGCENLGGGVAVINSNAEFKGCKIVNNILNDHGYNTNGFGGGLALVNISGADYTVVLDNVLVQGNSVKKSSQYNLQGFGGGIFIAKGYTCTLKNKCIIGYSELTSTATDRNNSNSAVHGGGIYIEGNSASPGKLIIDGANSITYNYASGNGGGILAEGSLVMENNTDKEKVLINYNGCGKDQYGGGIYCAPSGYSSSCSYNIQNCTISNNGYLDMKVEDNYDDDEGCYGGGVAFSNRIHIERKPQLTNVYFLNNAGKKGGAVWTAKDLSLDGSCILEENSAREGGAIYASDSSNFTVTLGDSINPIQVIGNIAKKDGGAFFVGPNATFTVENGVITRNSACCISGGHGGGAIFLDGNSSGYGKLNFKKGEISENYLDSESRNIGGGAIIFSDNYYRCENFNMTGGVIKSNNAGPNGKGNGIYTYIGGKLSLGGYAYIAPDNDIYLTSSHTIDINAVLTPYVDGNYHEESTYKASSVATITPSQYTVGTQLLRYKAEIENTLINENTNNLFLVNTSEEGVSYCVDVEGFLSYSPIQITSSNISSLDMSVYAGNDVTLKIDSNVSDSDISTLATKINSSTAIVTLDLSAASLTSSILKIVQGRIRKVVLPDGLTSWRPYSNTGGSGVTMILEEFEISDSNTNFKVIDGVLYSKDGKKLIHYPQAKEGDSFTLPDEVNSIGEFAFYRVCKLKNLDWSESNLTTLEHACFEYSTSIQSVILPASVNSLPHQTFEGCGALKNVTCKTTSLGNFNNYTFEYCGKLESVTLYTTTVPALGRDDFSGCPSTVVIYVNQNMLQSFKNASGWSSMNIQRIP